MPLLDPVILNLAVALGIGLLIGAERERRKGSGPSRSFAGIRTFAVTSLAGAISFSAGGQTLLSIVTAACSKRCGVERKVNDDGNVPSVRKNKITAAYIAYRLDLGFLCVAFAGGYFALGNWGIKHETMNLFDDKRYAHAIRGRWQADDPVVSVKGAEI
jgi:hypothetical protein